MGNQVISEDELSESFQQQYTFNQQPYLLQKSTGKPFTIHKITTNSPEDTRRILQSVEKYKHSKCACISQLKQHYHKQNKSYCSDRENVYFLFHDHGKNTIKDEYLMRRYAEHRFKPQQIQVILSTMLCGMKQYNNNFGRVHKPMALQNICIQPKSHRLYVKDPWLCQSSTVGSFTNVMLTYPSPEKLNALYEDKDSFFDQYYSQIFTVGMLGLQLYQMDFVDEIYNTKRKNIDNEKLIKAIQSLPNQCNLKSGIRTLLQQKPARRTDIFHEWKINCLTPKRLQILEKDIDRQIVNIQRQKSQMRASYIETNAGQFNLLVENKNLTDLKSSSVVNSNNHRQHTYSNPAHSSVSNRKSNYDFYHPTNLNTHLPIKSDQFNSNLKKMEGSSVQYNKIDNHKIQHFAGGTQQNIFHNSFSNSLYHNKSASNLLEKYNNKNQLNINNKTHYQGGNSANAYNFSKSKIKKSFEPNASESFKLYRPQLHIRAQNKIMQPSNFNKEPLSNNIKLLSIKKPGRQQVSNSSLVYKKVVERDTPSFTELSSTNFHKQFPQNDGKDRLINSFNTQNSVKFGQKQIESLKPLKFNTSNSFNQTQTSQNQSKNQYIHHSSSLQKYTQKQGSSGKPNQSSLLDGRPRSISNQPNYSFGMSNFQNNKNVPSFLYSKQKWNLDNRVVVKSTQTQNKMNTTNNQNGILSIKDSKNKQIHSQNQEHSKFASYFDNLIKVNNQNQNNSLLIKSEQQQIKAVKNIETKSPINEWKVSEEQNKKNMSPDKQFQRVIQSPQRIIKPIHTINEVQSVSSSQYSEKQPGIYNDIKSYAEGLFSFNTNQSSANSMNGNKGFENELDQQRNLQGSHLNPNNNSKQTTPNRPTNKNKYNSTIVQVNEETPEASQNSNQGQVEYVIEEYETGSRYEGQKVNGMRNGKGKFYYQDGGHYEGEWKNNKMHGWGKLFYEGGRLAYQGHWSHDEFHGYGKVYNDNPIPLEGPFDYTNFDLLDDFWVYYEGTLVSDTKQGRGKIKLTNSEVFEGDFHADRIQGFGKYFTNDGNFIEGIWRESKLIKVLQTS